MGGGAKPRGVATYDLTKKTAGRTARPGRPLDPDNTSYNFVQGWGTPTDGIPLGGSANPQGYRGEVWLGHQHKNLPVSPKTA